MFVLLKFVALFTFLTFPRQTVKVVRNYVCRPPHFKCKVKQSRNRPGVSQSVPGGLGSQIS
jgi:hypothetical protein